MQLSGRVSQSRQLNSCIWLIIYIVYCYNLCSSYRSRKSSYLRVNLSYQPEIELIIIIRYLFLSELISGIMCTKITENVRDQFVTITILQIMFLFALRVDYSVIVPYISMLISMV